MSDSLVIINGEQRESISIFDHGFLYGDAIFDTVRFFDGKPFFLEKHIDRFFESAKKAHIPLRYEKGELNTMITNACSSFGKPTCFVRMVLTRGIGQQGLLSPLESTLALILTERPLNPLQKVSTVFSPVTKFSEDSFGRGIKSTSYALAAEVLQSAKQKNATEAIFINEKGFVSEATTSNVFFVKRGELFTTPLTSGALPGVTREVILNNFSVIEKDITPDELLKADEIFLTGTTNFVTIIEKLEDRVFETSSYATKVFERLQTLIS